MFNDELDNRINELHKEAEIRGAAHQKDSEFSISERNKIKEIHKEESTLLIQKSKQNMQQLHQICNSKDPRVNKERFTQAVEIGIIKL